ncbi:MAG: SDR family oxidoreductase [Gammaproteobacteria bacterium]|nr:SDR family oxidoreductase [Gammaproteobacteria bacterium]
MNLNISVRWIWLIAMAMLVTGMASMPTVMAANAANIADDYVPTVLITGSNRGIGLEFARQYAERGWSVIATARKPAQAEALHALASKYDNFIVEQLDVTDFIRVDALAAKYAQMPIDLLLHNAGISGGSEKQMFTRMEYDVFAKVLEVNTIAPLKISEAFYANVRASRDKKIVTVSSSEGSINGASQPRLYFYRSSKAALNMVMVNLALQLKRKGISVGMVNPGMTDTDFMVGLPKKMLRPTPEAVTDMMRNIDALTIETTGSFYQYDGTIIPW